MTVRVIGLAIDLIKVFFEVEIAAYWVTEEEGQKLTLAWDVGGCFRHCAEAGQEPPTRHYCPGRAQPNGGDARGPASSPAAPAPG